MRTHPRPPARALSWICVTLAALTAGWVGCSGTTMHVSGGSGGSAMGGAASSSAASVATVTSAGTGMGGGGSGGAGGSGGVSGAGGGCASAGTKACDGKCVAVDDPAYGCTPAGCAPCAMSYPNAMQACVNGACALGACDTGFENCDQKDSNGCEANIADDPANCGMCGATCTVPHATASCTQGMCGVGVCDSGWVDCNNDPTDGCEVDLMNDPTNCGGCGTQCGCPGDSCQLGVCGCTCAKGTAQCPGDPSDVCATMLGTNEDCNFCGDTCDLANAVSQCETNTAPPPAPEFACTLQSCFAGFADCDGTVANGCEVDTQTDPNNCGGCGVQCSGGGLCVMGVCATGGGDAG